MSTNLDHASAGLLAAARSHQDGEVRASIAAHPALGALDIFTACVAGRLEEVERLLAGAPGRARARDPIAGWTPLLYASGSPVIGAGAEATEAGLRIIDRLLAAGADPNDAADAPADMHEGRRATPVYVALAAGNLAAAKRLLSRGAAPDADALDYVLKYGRWDALDELIARNADVSRPNPRSGETPLFALADFREWQAWEGSPAWVRESPRRIGEGIDRLLAAGADADVPSAPSGETPLHRMARNGFPPHLAQKLLARGARLDLRRADGRTPYVLAIRADNGELARLFASRTPPPEPLQPEDVFLGACLRGEEGIARSLLDASPNLVGELGDEARALPVRAAFEGRVPALRTMAKLGFDLDVEQSEGGTALHVAAWQGRAEVVGALLELGASPRTRDRRYGGTPRDWARHGRANRRRPPEDYDQLELMLARAEPAGPLVPDTPA